jgi:hypothetical protein
MTRSKLLSFASLLAATLLSAPAFSQQQQSGPPQGQQGSPPPGYAGGPSSGPGAAQPPGSGPPAPVLIVTSVEVLRSDRAGGMDIVRARGLVTSGLWSQPHLFPITQGQPLDGVLDLVFEASSPGTPASLGSFMPVEAILPVESGHPYKGVRIRGGSNVVALKTLPGYAETPAPKEDCAKCMGKYFIAKGANPPAGATADNSVREADLPYTLRIIKPTDGIASYTLDPNRLTLVLSEDGRIIDAAWD